MMLIPTELIRMIGNAFLVALKEKQIHSIENAIIYIQFGDRVLNSQIEVGFILKSDSYMLGITQDFPDDLKIRDLANLIPTIKYYINKGINEN